MQRLRQQSEPAALVAGRTEIQGRLRSYVGWRCDPLRVQRHLCGVERMSAAAAIRTAQADQLGDQIIAAGFAPNGFVLDINGRSEEHRLNSSHYCAYRMPSSAVQNTHTNTKL